MQRRRAKRRGQRRGHWHARALDQDRNHRQAGGQGRFDLAPHHVLRIVQPPLPRRVADVEPTGTDHRQHDAGAADGARQRRLEIETRRDRVDIAEHALGPEQRLQPIGQPARGAATVVAAIAEKDIGHRGSITATSAQMEKGPLVAEGPFRMYGGVDGIGPAQPLS